MLSLDAESFQLCDSVYSMMALIIVVFKVVELPGKVLRVCGCYADMASFSFATCFFLTLVPHSRELFSFGCANVLKYFAVMRLSMALTTIVCTAVKFRKALGF